MKTKFKLFWPIIALLALNACQKETELVSPVQPTPPPVPVPVVDKNESVFSVDNTGFFYAYQALTGAIKWTYSIPAMSAFAPPAVSSKYTIFSDAYSATVYCMDTRSGNTIWQKGGISSSSFIAPLLVNDIIYYQ